MEVSRLAIRCRGGLVFFGGCVILGGFGRPHRFFLFSFLPFRDPILVVGPGSAFFFSFSFLRKIPSSAMHSFIMFIRFTGQECISLRGNGQDCSRRVAREGRWPVGAKFLFSLFIYSTSRVPGLIEIGMARGVVASYIGGHTQNPGASPTSSLYIPNSASCFLLCCPSRRKPS